MRLSGKVALITGAGSGIGREAALLFAREGASVLAVDIDESSAAGTAAALPSFLASSTTGGVVKVAKNGDGPGTIEAFGADIATDEGCRDMVAAAEERFGRLDVLFNNAGIMLADDADAVTTDEQVWERTMAVNAKGVFLGCKHGIPALQRADGGSIINTASFVGLMGAATPQIAYTASKGAVIAMSRELAVIHAREGIRVNALCPGPLRTELLMKVLDTDEKRQRRLVHIPIGRFGEATEIAGAALFLASDESSLVTGSTFVVDGGITAAYTTPE